jgi:hypothetical protein
MKLSSKPRPLVIAFDVMVIGDRGDRLKHFEAAQASAISRTDRRNAHHRRVAAAHSSTEVRFCQLEVSSRKKEIVENRQLSGQSALIRSGESNPMSSLAWQRAATPPHSPRF